jgi:serine/threonine-protein kinase
MRLVEGRDLQTVLADGPLDPVRAVLIIDQVAKALHAAHEVGLLHRDIKPSNILLDRNDFAYLIDFGIARAIEETRMTKSGDTIGTFQYIAPERLDTGTEDARADIYSLACVLYESLTGHPPFPGSSTAQLINAHLNAPPPRPSTTQPDVPAQVDDVIATGMAKDPDQRYATTVELADAAHNAITTPITRPAQSSYTSAPFATIPASPLPATESAAIAATDSSLPENTAPPRDPRGSPRGRPVLIAGITAAVLAAGFIIFQLRQPSQPASPTPAAQTAAPSGLTPAAPPPPPPVTEAALDGLLLTPAQIDTTMGANGMSIARPWSTFNDVGFNNPASPPECIPLSGAGEAATYNGSGSTAVRGQSLLDKDTSGKHRYLHWTEQAVVMFPSAQAASAFLNAATQGWPACANRGFHDNVDNAQWSAGQVTTTNGILTATAAVTPSTGWACQRALTARNNVVIDATGCGFNTTEQGISIAAQIASKVSTQ